MEKTDEKPRCLVLASRYNDYSFNISEPILAAGYEPIYLNKRSSSFETVRLIEHSDFVMAIVNNEREIDNEREMFYESTETILEIARSMNKPLLQIGGNPQEGGNSEKYFFIRYKGFDGDISLKVASVLIKYKTKFQRQKNGSEQLTPSLKVDWNSLETKEAENLIMEMLMQLQFKKIEWVLAGSDFDLMAELPKVDPDGFEYSEFWFISVGKEESLRTLLMFRNNPDELVSRLKRQYKRFYESAPALREGNFIILLISFDDSDDVNREFNLKLNTDDMLARGLLEGFNIRVRLWNQDYLTSLLSKFPHLFYKYFSDKSRKQSTVRKSYEELYKENAELLKVQTTLNQLLKEEQKKRIGAERDAIWKEISFSAAHKIGNPIFAIETDLLPLRKRVNESRIDDANDVINNITSAVEKAKAFIEQFKSLTRAQEIKPDLFRLKPILDDACKCVKSKGIQCIIACEEQLEIYADAQRLSECFDELVMNAAFWIEKKPPKETGQITLTVSNPDKLPDFLDKSHEYLLIKVKDNGPGIPANEKERIFDAFVTNREHGTGLGLALVRRIIEGHKGGIIEIGEPGQGADFEIFIPKKQDEPHPSPEKK